MIKYEHCIEKDKKSSERDKNCVRNVAQGIGSLAIILIEISEKQVNSGVPKNKDKINNFRYDGKNITNTKFY